PFMVTLASVQQYLSGTVFKDLDQPPIISFYPGTGPSFDEHMKLEISRFPEYQDVPFWRNFRSLEFVRRTTFFSRRIDKGYLLSLVLAGRRKLYTGTHG